ncbi:AcrR family transcriptional regulator [Psychromicrobium silvestre]|uniref:AcrR family transcriptional regulator n=1 Tax=Psychromicrobium silvestre TaxID=1645614 RepID=A0A7Y9LSM7_9MICC|nr:AcrR family transcriptional regulator [Psychromicrobium silvestre]
MSSAGQRGPYAKSAKRREEIISTALQVFSEQGFQGGSMREIASRVGLSQAGLLHHFKSKDELLLAVLELRDQMDWAPYRAQAHGLNYLTLMRKVVEHNATVPSLVQLYSRLSAEAAAPDHPAHQFFKERYRSTRAEAVGAIQESIQAGELRPDTDPEAIAELFTAVMDGLQLQWLYQPALNMPQAVDLMIESLLAKHKA